MNDQMTQPQNSSMSNQKSNRQHQSADTLNIAIIVHSNYGHTKRVAEAIATGVIQFDKSQRNEQPDNSATARHPSFKVNVIETDDIEDNWSLADKAHLIVFGSAVYMGSVTAEFKTFMDSTSKRWFTRKWHGKWAAGFANSGGLSGDKLSVLQQICLFSMQHGMNWAGFPIMPTGHSDTDINRLSSFMGLMTQSLDGPPEKTPGVGDIKTAELFGQHLAKLVSEQPPVLDVG